MLDKFSELTKNLGLGLALAFGLVYSTYVGTRSMERIRGTIDVKGYAEQPMKADLVTWTITPTVRHTNLAEGMKSLDAQVEKTINYLQENKIKPEEVSKDIAFTRTLYKKDDKGVNTNEIDQYEISRSLLIRSTDVEKIKDLSIKISDLITQGLEVSISTPNYLLDRDKFEKAKVDLLGEATKTAKNRADQFALNSGTNIGRLVSARQGVFQVTGENSTEVNDYGIYDLNSINKIVKIVVTLSYTTGS